MTWFYQRTIGARGEERFFADELTRGPWSNDHQHGGPPTALLARAIEAELARTRPDTPMFVVRLTVELLRPVPIAAPLEVVTEQLSRGRNVERMAAALLCGDQQLAVAVAVAVRVTELALPAPSAGSDALPAVERCSPFEFPFFRHPVGYHTAMEGRLAAGEFGSGDFAVWIRPRPALIEGEPTTPLQRVMICADAGHGVGTALDTERWSFINPDLSVHLHRLPSDEWLSMHARTISSPLGYGQCRTALGDRHGELGLAVQSQVIASRA